MFCSLEPFTSSSNFIRQNGRKDSLDPVCDQILLQTVLPLIFSSLGSACITVNESLFRDWCLPMKVTLRFASNINFQ
jgi:hypothetical protein